MKRMLGVAFLIIAWSLIYYSAYAAWYTNTANQTNVWLYRQKITISGASVEATLTNFPVVILITDTANAVFSKAQSDGRDILFTSSDEATKLSHDLDYYIGTGAPTMCAWVNIPTLASGTDTIIYMYYGSDNAATQENKTATWNNQYAAVYHLKEDTGTHTAGFIKDSTSNSNNASADAIMASTQEVLGKFDGSVNFTGNSKIAAPNSTSFTITNEVTLSAWVKAGGQSALFPRIAAKSFTSNITPYTNWGIEVNSNRYARMEIDIGGTFKAADGTTVVASNGAWSYIAGTYDGSNIRVYKNGTQEGFLAQTGSMESINQVFSIGASGFSADYFIGLIDEVHVMNKAMTASWIKTEYNNQSNPLAFYTLSDEQRRPSVRLIGKNDYFPLGQFYSP